MGIAALGAPLLAAGAGSAASAAGVGSLIVGGGVLAGKGLTGLARGPQPPSPPQPPALASLLTRPPSLLGPGEGSFGGTYLTGGILGNRAKNTSGGLKTLLGG